MKSYITSALISLSVACVAIAVWSFVVLPKLSHSQVRLELETQSNDYNPGLIDRLNQADTEAIKISNELNSLKQKAISSSQGLEQLLQNFEDRTGILKVDSGSLTLSKKDHPNLHKPESCIANRGLINHPVSFNTAFSSPPKVFASFTKLDFGHGQDHRLRIEVSDISSTGFSVTFATWCDTSMSISQAEWIAIGT